MKRFLLLLLVASFVFGGTAMAAKTITLWYPAGDIAAGTNPFADKELFKDFEKETGITVVMEALDYDTMQQKIFTAAVGEKIADILFIDTSWLPGFLKEGMLELVPEQDAKAWLAAVSPEIVELSYAIEGKIYGITQFGIDIYGITWNKDQFAEVGLDPNRPPKTFAELREYSKKLAKTDASGNLTRVGYAIRHVGQPHGIVHKSLWAIWGAGGDLVDNPRLLRGGHAAFNTPGVKAALKLIYDMIYVDKSTSLNFPDPRAAILQGIAAMQISELISIQARAPKEAPQLKWGLALPPALDEKTKPASLLGAWMFSVPIAAKNKAEAFQAIKWLNTAEKDFELAKKYNSSPRYKVNWDKEPFKSDPYNQSLKQLLPYGRSLPVNLGLNGILEALGGAIQKYWHNEADLDTALAEAEKAANKAIAEAAK
jgi:ABC-type glycerol-3-phosphate transport system substrate-binding protein